MGTFNLQPSTYNFAAVRAVDEKSRGREAPGCLRSKRSGYSMVKLISSTGMMTSMVVGTWTSGSSGSLLHTHSRAS